MTKRIFRAVCITAVAIFLATMLMILDVLYNYFTNAQQKQLTAETSMAAAAMEHSGIEFLTDLKPEEYRITWIADDGTVLFDSLSDTDTMENHLGRKEIKDALATGYGESSRYSTTLLKRSLYCAQRLSDGSVLRLSVTHGSVLLLLIGMFQPMLVIMIIAAIISFVMAKGLSGRIVEPLNRLDPETPPENSEYPELDPLLKRIHWQQVELQKRADSLERKQEELNTVISNMNEGMLLVDANRQIISINRAAREMLDLPDYYEGDRITENDMNPEFNRVLDTAIRGEAADIRAQLHHSVIQISASPVQTNSGRPYTAIVLFDITQRERAEQQRREFTANVSHELKTPLHSISGYSELLKCGMVKPEDISAFAANIYNETQRLIALVEDIINLSHLDEGGVDLQWEDIDLCAVAGDVLSSLSEFAKQNGVSITLGGCSSRIHGVYSLVRAIIYNLCDNAAKYNRPGGKIEITVSERRVTVRDTGIGIPEEHLDRIFERFYRVDKSHSKEVGGTGLGLSIVKHAAAILNASIEVDSVVGSGTTVTVTFR